MKQRTKILLVIDDRALNASLEKALGKLRYQTSWAKGNVLSRVFDEVPHLILIDEDYGGGEGRKIALGIKEDVVLKYIPIILFSGVPQRADDPIDYVFYKRDPSPSLLALIQEVLARNYNELDLNPLTHLPGIRSSVLCLERLIGTKKPFSVSSVDLSNLQAFNEAYGDARGDEIIIRLAEITQNVLRKEGGRDDFLGHLGGDDFIFVTHTDLAVQVAREIIRQFDEAIPNFYDAHDRKQGYLLQKNKDGLLTRYPMMSISIAIVDNDRYPITEVADISRVASELQKRMKSLPGSCYLKEQRPVPDEEENGGSAQPLLARSSAHWKAAGLTPEQYEAFVQTVLVSRRIGTVYQPIVELKTRRIHGYEALTRGPAGGEFANPDVLFGIARETGRIQELDKLCLDFALMNGQSLPPERKLFLNLNHETLVDRKFMKNLFSSKGAIGYKNIVIEVTEESLLRSFEKVRETLVELKEQGASVAIDDVGGGAVSLRDVAILKPDYMKFDRSLVRQIDQSVTKQQILISMILFANGIRAVTTAEGIETKEEYQTLLMCGIELGQGYYFARPEKAFLKSLVEK